MTTFRIVLAAVAASLLAGCIIPRARIAAPEVEARLVDASSGMPVAGAVATLSAPEGSNAESRIGVSGPDGRLEIDEIIERLWLPPLPIDLFPLTGVLRIEAAGYESYEGTTDQMSENGQRSEWVIELKPKGK